MDKDKILEEITNSLASLEVAGGELENAVEALEITFSIVLHANKEAIQSLTKIVGEIRKGN